MISQHNSSAGPPRVPNWVQFVSWGVVFSIALVCEAIRWGNEASRQEILTGWLAGQQADWLPFLPLLLLAPLFWWMRRGHADNKSTRASWLTKSVTDSQSSLPLCLFSLFIFAFGFLISRWSASHFHGLPPAYHDEYSYLFQAKTFLAGRLWFPSFEPHPELFNQLHVLNEGRFASRYFPGTGLWMAPFVTWGDPWLGHQIAHGLTAMLLFWIGRELSCNGVGLLAALLFSLSPGTLLFSSLLLAHHPTLVGLSLMTWGLLRWWRTRSDWLLVLAGTGLTWGMFCRPMTAAGFGLPFGIAFVVWWMTGWPKVETHPLRSPWQRTRSALLLGVPLVLGHVLMLWYNLQITGSMLVSPYQLYTDIYTPRHVYGFNNVIRGEQHLGPKVLENYDRWALNLTPALAAKNVFSRLENSLRWSLGIVPLLLGCLVVVLTSRRSDWRWWLVMGSIVSLHVAHVPYWFEGIMGWHYVFESSLLWILIFAEAIGRLSGTWRITGQRMMRYWGVALIAVTVSVNLVTIRPLWPGQLPRGMAEIEYPRRLYGQFRQSIEQLRQGRDAIVLVIPDPDDRHMDYVTNRPDLKGAVLVARIPNRDQVSEVAALFPDRIPFLFDARERSFSRVIP